MSNARTLDLAKPRVLAFRDRGSLLKFTFRCATLADWKAYFEAIVSTSVFDGKERTDTTDTRSAKLGLVQALLVDAAGYAPIGGKPLTEIAEWQTKIPVSHQLVLGDMFVATKRFAAPQGDEGFQITLEGEKVEIESFWSYDDALGAMIRHAPLVHHFDTPTPDQQRRYARDSSRSMVVGGSRSQKTVWKGAQLTLIALYDELITGVEGYSNAGEAIGPNRARAYIADTMDPFHKVVAAAQLFAAAEVETD